MSRNTTETVRIRHRDRLLLRELRAPNASRERALKAVLDHWLHCPEAHFDGTHGAHGDENDSSLRTTTIRVGKQDAYRIEAWRPDEMSTAAAVGLIISHYDKCDAAPENAPRTSSDTMALPFNMDRSGLTDETSDDDDRRPVV